MYPLGGAHRTWTRDGFVISTDPSLIPLTALNAAFASPTLYWAKELPEDVLRACLENSLSFGLYSPTAADLPPGDASKAEPVRDAKAGSGEERAAPEQTGDSQPALIGFARLITDGVTFAYLTDVYVLEEWRGRKLGEWLVGCVHEVTDGMPYLRRVMAILGEQELVGFYQRTMGLEMMKGDGPAWVIQRRGRGSVFA